MKVLRIDLETQEEKTVNYPRLDLAPLPAVKGKYEYYVVVDDDRPTLNQFESIKYSIELTKEKYEELDHILIARRRFEVIKQSSESIISQMNNAVGEHIESNFPLWKQIKYLNKKDKIKEKSTKTTADLSDLTYLESLFDWVYQCRIERDNKESELITNGTLPDLYNWSEMPIKPE